MKKNNWIVVVLLLAYVFFSIMFVFYVDRQQKRELALNQKLYELENNLYTAMLVQMESSLLAKMIVPIDGMRKGDFVLVFPDDVCDVCNKWIFGQLRENKDSVRIKAVIPPKMKKTMQVYNKMYDLHLSNVLYSDKLKLPENTDNPLYIFYYSEKGDILFPLLLKDKSFDLKTYMNMVNALIDGSSM